MSDSRPVDASVKFMTLVADALSKLLKLPAWRFRVLVSARRPATAETSLCDRDGLLSDVLCYPSLQQHHFAALAVLLCLLLVDDA